jgi:hypothetical protein
MIWMWITYGWLLEKAKICDGYQFMIITTTSVSELTMLIDLLPPIAACYACRNIRVSASSWVQGAIKSVSIALLLTTFSSLVTTSMVKCWWFTTSAVDNIDHNPSATTATTSCHGTGISDFQYPVSSTFSDSRTFEFKGQKPKSKAISFAACFACRSIRVSTSSWVQGAIKSVSIALLLTKFSSLVTTSMMKWWC